MFDDSQSPESGSEKRRQDGPSEQGSTDAVITRRSALKLAGSATAFAAAGSTVSGASYDTITVPSYTKENIYVGSGEVWENKLIDITAAGASVQIIPGGNDWTVRNVGIEGVHSGGHYVLTPYVSDHDSTGVVENVYAGDGQVERTGKGFCWVQYDHRGTIEFRNVNVQHFVDNGLYTSSPGDEQNHTHGRAHMYDSYFYSNNISNCRTGAREDTNGMSHDHVCHVDGCTIVVDHTVPPCEEGCSSPGAQNSRAVWAVNGAVSVTDCDVQVDTSYGGYFDTLHGGYYENDPWADNRTGSAADTSIPEGVPTTPEDAASGTSDGGGGDTTEVAEDFSHADVPGTYSLDTGAFTTTSTRATTGSYSIRADDSTDSNELVLREDMVTSAGNTYELDLYFPSDTDVGIMFGVQGATGYSDYTGYSGFFEGDDDEIRIDYLENGSFTNQAATATTWPLDEWLTVELDYRDSDASTITMTVFDASGAEVASVSLADTTYDSGSIGWYNWYADADWHADSWFDAGSGGSTAVLDAFEDGDISEYDGHTSTYSAQSSTTLEGSYTLEASDTWGQLAHTSTTTPRGNEYRCQIMAPDGSGAEPGLLVSVQDASNAIDNCYWATPNASAGTFDLWLRDGGYSYELDSISATFQEGTTYEVALELGSDTVKAVLYDSSGNVVAETSSVSDATHSGGTFGFYTNNSTPAYYDYVTKTSL